jgi:putative DNA primase/helicase
MNVNYEPKIDGLVRGWERDHIQHEWIDVLSHLGNIGEPEWSAIREAYDRVCTMLTTETAAEPDPFEFTDAERAEFLKPDSLKTHAQCALGADSLSLVPAELKAKTNWVRWKMETVNGRLTKVPYQLSGQKASSTDPATWNAYDQIIADAVIDENQGVGVMTDSSFIGFDLDGCRNPQTAEIAPWATRIIESLSAYTEITPSGYGVRVYAFGKLPDGARRFSINSAAGFGPKIGIEVYDHARYFAVTGKRIGEHTALDTSNVLAAYELCRNISQEFAAEKRKNLEQFQANDGGSVKYEKKPNLRLTSKMLVLMHGQITSRTPKFVIEDEGGIVTADSQSEADMSLCTLLAMKHGDNPELIDAEFRESSLYRHKWDRLAETTIEKAIATAKKFAEREQITVVAAPSSASESQIVIDLSDENQIPEFDDTVITGIYRDIVDLAVRGTTIPPQFAFLNAKVYMGARMAGSITFEGLDCDSSYYGVAIGVTGTSKGESWRRTFEKILNASDLSTTSHMKVIYGADSGAGLKDVFFEPPTELPVVCYVDEVTTLGHKAGEKKNPEILDTIIELADSHHISRVKAKHGKQSSKTHNNARLSVYMCGQDGPAFMGAFTGRTKLGLFDRLYPEFSGPIEAGDLPDISPEDIVGLHAKLGKLTFAGKMTMARETENKLNDFWRSQPGDIRRKIRFKKYLMLDMYMAAFGRGVMIAEPEDLNVAIKIFNRQIVIRRLNFTGEVPDRVGFYTAKIKAIVDAQRNELNQGKTVAQVAKSNRDFQTLTNAFRDNEVHTFERAWKSLSDHVTPVAVIAGNGQKYQKWVPMPYEHEMWLTPSTSSN